MSTILKALRRLEHEKTAPVGQRPLREEVTQSAAEARRSRGAGGIAFERHRPAIGTQPQPFDGHRAGPGTDVP